LDQASEKVKDGQSYRDRAPSYTSQKIECHGCHLDPQITFVIQLWHVATTSLGRPPEYRIANLDKPYCRLRHSIAVLRKSSQFTSHIERRSDVWQADYETYNLIRSTRQADSDASAFRSLDWWQPSVVPMLANSTPAARYQAINSRIRVHGLASVCQSMVIARCVRQSVCWAIHATHAGPRAWKQRGTVEEDGVSREYRKRGMMVLRMRDRCRVLLF